MKFLWKIGGEAGFGIVTSGLSVAKIATHSGYHIFDYTEYPSLIRGGHNTYDVTISDEEIHANKWEIDLLVCLNKDTYFLHKDRLHGGSIVIYDSDEFEIVDNITKIAVPFKKFKKEFEIHQMMVNTIAIGASVAIMGGDISIFHNIIEDQFTRKGTEVVDFNKKLASVGYEHVVNNYPNKLLHTLVPHKTTPKMVMTGNDAFSFAAVAADCRYYAAYPMTPASTVLTSLASWQGKTGMVVRHSEDEIAVINSALGAAFSGVRAAVGTSGGGFALMVEALSFAGVAEIPIVTYLGQRPGPATGLPTWTEQGDLLFAVHAGHGEFPKIVLAPGDIQEMVELTTKAFDLADIYQLPVIIMSDKLLGESHKSDEKETIMSHIATYKPNYGKKVSKTSQNPYLRYKITEDGISEMLIPGAKGSFYQANSYEHEEDSHTTEHADIRIAQVEKRDRKWKKYLNEHFQAPTIFGNIEKADIVFVSWGGNKGSIVEAQRLLSINNINTAYIHFTHVYPMNAEFVTPLFTEDKRYILIENNHQAQFGQLLRMQTGIHLEEKFLKFDGRPFWPEEIVEYVKKNPATTKSKPLSNKQISEVKKEISHDVKEMEPVVYESKQTEEDVMKKLSSFF